MTGEGNASFILHNHGFLAQVVLAIELGKEVEEAAIDGEAGRDGEGAHRMASGAVSDENAGADVKNHQREHRDELCNLETREVFLPPAVTPECRLGVVPVHREVHCRVGDATDPSDHPPIVVNQVPEDESDSVVVDVQETEPRFLEDEESGVQELVRFAVDEDHQQETGSTGREMFLRIADCFADGIVRLEREKGKQ